MELGPQTRVLVSGASRGIGRATAERFAARGCVLGLLARSGDELESLAAELGRRGSTAHALIADLCDSEQVHGAVRSFIEQSGGLDALVANAGVANYGPFRDLPIEEAERMTQVNWLGTVRLVAAALPHLLDRASGRIVIVSSAASYRAFPWAAVYGATKFAQRGFLEALRHELSGTGVGLTGVYPGQVETHLHDDDRTGNRMPDWHHPDAAILPSEVADAIVNAVERDDRSVFVPRKTRLLGIMHGISPALADRVLRRMLGRTAAPS